MSPSDERTSPHDERTDTARHNVAAIRARLDLTGDSVQSDVAFGSRNLANHPGAARAVFIHDVVTAPAAARQLYREARVVFSDTYVGTAREALAQDLATGAGAQV